MIVIDPRDGNDKEHTIRQQMLSYIRRIGVQAQLFRCESGDFAFEGWGPGNSSIMVGVERKSLHDMLHCIDDNRYNIQRVKMHKEYKKSFLIVEGMWKAHDSNGMLMEGFPNNDGGISWAYCRYMRQPVMYAKLYRYLLSVALSGVVTTFSRDLFQTCFNVCEMYHWFQKKWESHTSLLEKQELSIPQLLDLPNLTRRWAAEIDAVGVKRSAEAERLFRSPVKLANSDELDWMRITGIGAPTARKIVRQLNGLEEG